MSTKLRYGTPEEAGMSAERIQRARNLAEEWSKQEKYPAIVALVARRGTIVLHEAFGRLNPKPDSPALEPDAIFPLASLAKPITAALIMCLVEDGLLSLNHPVSDYIPEFAGEGKDKVMIHHLLTHTSGIMPGIYQSIDEKKGTVEVPVCDDTQHPALNEQLFLGYTEPLGGSPGEVMMYCGFNYALLGDMVRRITGKSLESFARERIFGPLDMKDAFYEIPNSVKHRIVGRPEDAPFIEGIKSWIEEPSGEAGVISTAMDMAVFGQMFLNSGVYGDTRILSPASVAQMTRDQVPGIGWRYGEETGPDASWGYGWGIHGCGKSMDAPTLCSSKTFSHGGAGTVILWVDPVHEIVGCFFAVSLANERIYREHSMFIDVVTAAVMS